MNRFLAALLAVASSTCLLAAAEPLFASAPEKVLESFLTAVKADEKVTPYQAKKIEELATSLRTEFDGSSIAVRQLSRSRTSCVW